MSHKNKHDDFYRAFEDKFRGSRALIRNRLEFYTPFLHAIFQETESNTGLDLGCGRGEWLELLLDNRFEGIGLDIDEGMLQVSRERGLNVLNSDAVEFLRSQQASSFNVVTGFHIAEHIPFEQLQALIEEAHRILKPGGLLILETPNPENFRVSSLTFYLDPTHRNPIPPILLLFMVEYYGFAQSKIVRLQEAEGLLSLSDITLEQVLGSASPDYSIIAQKGGREDECNAVRKLFEEDYGIESATLLDKFEDRLQRSTIVYDNVADTLSELQTEQENLSNTMAEKTDDLQGKVDELSSIVQNDQLKFDQLTRQYDCLHAEMSGYVEAEHVARQKAETALDAMYSSNSWRVTAPFRAFSRGIRWFRDGSVAWITLKRGSRPRRTVRVLVTHMLLWIRLRPKLTKYAMRIIQKFPKIERRLRDLQASIYTNRKAPNSASRPADLMPSQILLSPRGRAILADVHKHIKNETMK